MHSHRSTEDATGLESSLTTLFGYLTRGAGVFTKWTLSRTIWLVFGPQTASSCWELGLRFHSEGSPWRSRHTAASLCSRDQYLFLIRSDHKSFNLPGVVTRILFFHLPQPDRNRYRDAGNHQTASGTVFTTPVARKPL